MLDLWFIVFKFLVSKLNDRSKLLVLEPNDESGANVDAAKMWREDREEFNRIAEKIVKKTLGIPA